ncbi:hypothetical protein TNCV_5041911 [Trichonephila clavipes]|nr:hypothetical protein TNCV_5041911 [Trichonephila clavipes]
MDRELETAALESCSLCDAGVGGGVRYATETGLSSNPGEDADVCKCIVLLQHGGTLNSCQAASLLVRLVEGEGSCTRAFGDGPRHLESWSSDEDLSWHLPHLTTTPHQRKNN